MLVNKCVPTMVVGWFFNKEEALNLLAKLEASSVPTREHARTMEEVDEYKDDGMDIYIIERLSRYSMWANGLVRKAVCGKNGKFDNDEKYWLFYIGHVVHPGSPTYTARQITNLSQDLTQTCAGMLEYLGEMRVKTLIDCEN